MSASHTDRTCLAAAATAALDYLAGLREQRVFPSGEALALLNELRTPMPDRGRSADDVVRQLGTLGASTTVATAGPRFFGYVTGGAVPASAAAAWLAAAWDQTPSDGRLSPLVAELERVTGAWLLDLLRLPTGSCVGYVTGSTMANLVGLAAGREYVMQGQNWDVQAKGLIGAPPIRIIVGAEVHATIPKALGLLGLGRDTAIRVAADKQGRMIASAVPPLGPDCIVCLQAGNVNSGAFDPFADIIPKAKEAGAWVHIDGAFGLVAAASPEHAPLLAGHDLADSWSVSGHKWFNTPYDCGVAINRHPDLVRRAFAYNASYLDPDTSSARNFVPELSRRARAVEMYAALASLGKEGVRELVVRSCGHARRFAEGLSRLGFEILNEVVLNKCVAAIGENGTAQRIAAHVSDSGEAWFSTTEWQGRSAIRLSISNWSTTTADIDRTLSAIERAVRAEGLLP
jgi:glutamate/tyrosine decarboxylase-like PLP-dependent enzyme